MTGLPAYLGRRQAQLLHVMAFVRDRAMAEEWVARAGSACGDLTIGRRVMYSLIDHGLLRQMAPYQWQGVIRPGKVKITPDGLQMHDRLMLARYAGTPATAGRHRA